MSWLSSTTWPGVKNHLGVETWVAGLDPPTRTKCSHSRQPLPVNHNKMVAMWLQSSQDLWKWQSKHLERSSRNWLPVGGVESLLVTFFMFSRFCDRNSAATYKENTKETWMHPRATVEEGGKLRGHDYLRLCYYRPLFVSETQFFLWHNRKAAWLPQSHNWLWWRWGWGNVMASPHALPTP